MENLIKKIEDWGNARKIITNGKVQTQVLKLMSELGELADNIIKGADVRDDIGDCLVVLTLISKMAGTDLKECAQVAYDDIKDRKGFLNKQGNFIKSTDPLYEQALKGESKNSVVVSINSMGDLFKGEYVVDMSCGAQHCVKVPTERVGWFDKFIPYLKGANISMVMEASNG